MGSAILTERHLFIDDHLLGGRAGSLGRPLVESETHHGVEGSNSAGHYRFILESLALDILRHSDTIDLQLLIH